MKTWAEMTDAEKGALLLAHHLGESIQNKASGVWLVAPKPHWMGHGVYRVKPKETTYGTDQWCIPHDGCDGAVSLLYGPIDGATKGRSVVTYMDGKPVKYTWEADQ